MFVALSNQRTNKPTNEVTNKQTNKHTNRFHAKFAPTWTRLEYSGGYDDTLTEWDNTSVWADLHTAMTLTRVSKREPRLSASAHWA